MKYTLISVLTIFILSGCAGALPWNDQNDAGIEKWSVAYKDGFITKVSYINGKELGSSDIEIWLADGTKMSLKASDVKAFKGQQTRASVEKAISEQFGDVAPEVVDAIIKAFKGN